MCVATNESINETNKMKGLSNRGKRRQRPHFIYEERCKSMNITKKCVFVIWSENKIKQKKKKKKFKKGQNRMEGKE